MKATTTVTTRRHSVSLLSVSVENLRFELGVESSNAETELVLVDSVTVVVVIVVCSVVNLRFEIQVEISPAEMELCYRCLFQCVNSFTTLLLPNQCSFCLKTRSLSTFFSPLNSCLCVPQSGVP